MFNTFLANPVGGDRKRKTRFFDTTVVRSSPFHFLKRPMTNTINTSINSIFDTVHRHMKSQPRILTATPSIPQPILDIKRFEKKPTTTNKNSKAAPIIQPSEVNATQSRTSHKTSRHAFPKIQKTSAANIASKRKISTKAPPIPATSKNFPNTEQTVTKSKPKMQNRRNKTLSQLKATVQQKCQQNMRRSLVDSNGQYYSNLQSRISEIKRHRQTLDEILKDYSKLKRDRETLAHEMQVMKGYLDDITGRLDESVKKLNKTPLIYDRVMTPRRVVLNNKVQEKYITKPKKNQRPIKLHSRLFS